MDIQETDNTVKSKTFAESSFGTVHNNAGV